MITPHSFTKDWLMHLNRVNNWNRKETQLKNVEKAIVALYLLECLVQTQFDFIFKGGTSLLLHFGKINRFSVDIDLIANEIPLNLNCIFEQVCANNQIFYRFERQNRKRDEVFLTQHFKFFYRPFADETDESYILLDIYPIINPYAKIVELEIKSDILNTMGNNISVKSPDIDSLLGDKLTAFAPTTIGISLIAEPDYRPKRVEVLKQLYDIGLLFDSCQNVAHIRQSYWTIAQHEIKQKKLALSPEDVLRDSDNWAFLIGHSGKLNNGDYQLLAKGFNEFSKFVSDMHFTEQEAVLCAAKTAYLSRVLLTGAMTVEKYDDIIDMKQWKIEEKRFEKFNDYKYINQVAFFYWMKSIYNS